MWNMMYMIESHTHTHTYPLILGQWVVDHQVLLACSLARVSDVLRQKTEFVTAQICDVLLCLKMHDHIVAWVFPSAAAHREFEVLPCLQLFCVKWDLVFHKIHELKMYLEVCTMMQCCSLQTKDKKMQQRSSQSWGKQPQSGALTVSLIFSYWARSSLVLLIHCPLSSGRTSRYNCTHTHTQYKMLFKRLQPQSPSGWCHKHQHFRNPRPPFPP